MKTLIVFAFLIACISARKLETEQALENGLHPFSSQMVYLINKAQKTWTAKQHFNEDDFQNFTSSRLGAILEHNEHLPEVSDLSSHLNMDAPIPKEFDARKQWPACAEIISDIRDQANCGSCWAFAAVGSMSDRICIASNGAKKVRVSAEDLLACCTLTNSFSFCGFGCNGGIVPLAWRYWVKRGIVSGGNWHDKQPTCKPYTIEPCGKNNKEHEHKCSGTAGTPKCVKKCVNNADYNKDKTYGQKAYSLKGAENIQREIMQHGSVEAAFTVMADFPQYSGGVYQATTSSALGGHAVRIIGWGVENNVPYWLVANSWNVLWGEQGYFKILRGSNHCGIESAIAAGLPKV